MSIDCVDLFYVHRRQPEIPIEEVAGSLGRLKKVKPNLSAFPRLPLLRYGVPIVPIRWQRCSLNIPYPPVRWKWA